MFSVIIPALNEESCISQTLRSIADDEDTVEVIVADGGSLDAARYLRRTGRLSRHPQLRRFRDGTGGAQARSICLSAGGRNDFSATVPERRAHASAAQKAYLWLHFILRTEPGQIAHHFPYDDSTKSKSVTHREVYHGYV